MKQFGRPISKTEQIRQAFLKWTGPRCGATLEKLPSGVRVRVCRRRVKNQGDRCWSHR